MPYQERTHPSPLLIAVVCLLISGLTHAEPLTVAVKSAPPFSYQEEGHWTGISVDLWHQLAGQLGQDYQLRPYPSVSEMLEAVEQGQADVAIGAISVTADRERRLDFTQPMFRAGLGIATPSSPSGWLTTLQGLFSWKFLSAVTALVLVLLAVGVVVWLLERHRNPEQFGGSIREGIGSGFWWSAVTMTTVGYGDKAPITPAGRVIGLIWMFVSIITISGFTAAIASSVTVNQLQTRVSSVADLPRVKVGTVDGTSASHWLDNQGIAYRPYPNIAHAMQAVAQGRVDAVVHDAPVMRYLLRQNQENEVLVLPQLAREESYAIAVANGSPLREPLDQALLGILNDEGWRGVVTRYLGAE
ncbi:extracellular solute-binding protein family 3 [Alcanivorax xiamenensis]|uniref:Extracellular solute-binding protein family 3 n=1 Tax=Alcanivorax xiamenensis TaxID=1177156 RepID=A0ABQ6Y8G8_9GAMM|nr:MULTISPECIES: transporter substrate-binding domain-containing protein [Alcanivorax]KAF0805897.1 extracellular solute-binding protein family 3 [Alcanivorax xiamenensis]